MVPHYPHIVRRESGPGTATGYGDRVQDSNGVWWRIVDSAEASMLRQGTGNSVATLHSDGTIR